MNSKDLVLLYARKWREQTGAGYKISFAKECTIFKRLGKTYTSDELVGFVEHYLNSFRSDFAVRNGYSVGAFSVELPAIIYSYTEEKKKRELVSHPDLERVEEARNAIVQLQVPEVRKGS